MVSHSSIVRARIDSNLKENAKKMLSEQGLSLSDAIRLMLKQVVIQKTLPFEIKAPNKETLETFKKTDKDRDIVTCENAKDMFDKLGL